MIEWNINNVDNHDDNDTALNPRTNNRNKSEFQMNLSREMNATYLTVDVLKLLPVDGLRLRSNVLYLIE